MNEADNGHEEITAEAAELCDSEEAARAALLEELEEYKRKYLHSLAEGENVRKRLLKERQESQQYAVQALLLEFLNPIDQLEAALGYAGSASDEVRNWAVGFEMILTQFKNVLSSHGVQPFASVGQPFDPHCHEALELVETADYPAGTVVRELLRGYRYGADKVLRAARVAVAKEAGDRS